MQNDILTPKVKREGEPDKKVVLTPKSAPAAERRVGEPARKNKFETMSLVQEEKRMSVIDGLIDPTSVFGKTDIEALDKKFAEKEKEFWEKSSRKNKA